jgi:hypothetical protein
MRRSSIRHGLGLAVLGLAIVGTAGCTASVEAPADKGVCWHMVQQKAAKPKFFPLSQNEPDLEHCAAALEGMRLKFLILGGSISEVEGAYQGQFLFVDPRGVFTSTTLDAAPFPFLVHSGDGHLVPPGTPPS